MRKIAAIFAAFCIMFAVYALAPTASAKGGLEIGATAANFKLSDTDGKSRTLDTLKGTNGTLVIWVSAQCPVVKGYKDRINEIAAAYEAKGVAVIGINSNATEDLDWVKSNKSEYAFKFPILIDKNNSLADKWGAKVTPEVFYLDAANVLRYHGAIDNDRGGHNITDPFLKKALDEALGGKPVTRSTAAAFGCTIKRAGE